MPDRTTWLMLVVDDDPETLRLVKDILEGETLTSEGDTVVVETQTSFADALGQLEANRYDMLILDVREGDYDLSPETEAGTTLFTKIKQKRFLPIIFYTGLPNLVSSIENTRTTLPLPSSVPERPQPMRRRLLHPSARLSEVSPTGMCLAPCLAHLPIVAKCAGLLLLETHETGEATFQPRFGQRS